MVRAREEMLEAGGMGGRLESTDSGGATDLPPLADLGDGLGELSSDASDATTVPDDGSDATTSTDVSDHNGVEFGTAEIEWDPTAFDGLGDPVGDATFWHEQQASDTCAVVAQGSILEATTGVPFDEARLTAMAQADGSYTRGRGTIQSEVGRLLDRYGLEVETSYDTPLTDLAEALERGDRVLVAVDGDELFYQPRDPNTGLPVELVGEGHAVWVTGIENRSEGDVVVIVNDPGSSLGRMMPVALPDFVNAWEDFGRQMVVARKVTE